MVSHLWLKFILLLHAGSLEASSSDTSTIVPAKWEFHEFRVHITVILFLLVMILIKLGFHRIPYVAHYVPESLLLILLGIVFGAIVRYGIRSGTFEGAEWRLTPQLFFIYLLPPIVLEASYSLYNRTFGEYLGVVLIFAVLGTILNFLLIGFAMYGLLMSGALGSERERFDLKGMLLFSSLVVAVDPVAVLAIFQDIGVELSLYYIVFGESLFNDAITVVLYDIMSAFAGTDDVTGQQIAVGIASFFTVSFGGLLVGVIVGIISCLITRIKSHLNAFTLILLAYFSYIMGDCVGWSGIISMIGCGLVQAAYAFHNLDGKSVTLVHKLTKLVAEVSESVIFLFLGVEVLSDNLEWHAGFMLWSLVLCLAARAIVVFSITAIVNAVNVDNTNISITKQLVLVYGGLRGAVAFSLAVLVTPEHLGDHGTYSRRVMITATLFIILFTVGFMGMTLKPLVKLLKIRMQAKRQLSLFSVLNGSVIDETLAGIEIMTDSKGRNVVRDLFMRLDEKYIRRLLQREPESYDHKIMRVYERIALRLHFASMQPEKMEVFLEEIPPTLRNKYMHAFQSSVSLSGLVPQFSWSEHPSSRSRDTVSMANGRCNTTNQLHVEETHRVSRSVQSLNDLTNEFVDNMRSTRKVTIVSHEKRQVTFDESLKDIVESRKRSFVKRFTVNPQAAESLGPPNKSCVEEVNEVGSVDPEQASVVSTSDNQAVSLWTDNASEDSDVTE
ncbi:Sodium/hydrogen exchanger 3 [Clonorchis sinensis]|uniref:Sodium/hydrogen exchanger n=2 Tax=Clonorchis sinensis TaxID=79923 RepID=G7YR51_CLOSI|nr:Sodium/hydrogen exchanger 3 [Clonorchis sinensis]GAA55431.1 sodium/hydrogen exchanger 2 [Clonorchis sinensis]